MCASQYSGVLQPGKQKMLQNRMLAWQMDIDSRIQQPVSYLLREGMKANEKF